VDRPALRVGRRLLALVDRLTDHVPEAAERRLADRDGDLLPRVLDLEPAGEAVGGVHRHGADAVVAKELLNLGDHVAAVGRDAKGVVDLRQLVGEDDVEDDALDLHDLAHVFSVLSHEPPEGTSDVENGARSHGAAPPQVYPSSLPESSSDASAPRRPPHGRHGRALRRVS
jgi:hypothetical protein